MSLRTTLVYAAFYSFLPPSTCCFTLSVIPPTSHTERLNSPLPSVGRSRSRRQVSGRGSIGQWQYVYYSGAGLYDDCFYFRPPSFTWHLEVIDGSWGSLQGLLLRMNLLFDRDNIEHKLCSVHLKEQN